MYTIEAMLLLLGVLSGFVTGVIAGLGLYRSHSTHNELSMTTLDKLLLGLSLLAALVFGMLISFVLRYH
jgi:hypothetical protein